MNANQVGLVLEGGAMRGMFTTGILDVFLENDVVFDGVIGVSAGVVFGINYKSKQIGRGIRYNKKYCRDPRYVSLRSLIRTGDLYNADFCYRELPNELDVFDVKAYQENPLPFYGVVTDVDTGKPVYVRLDRGDEKDVLWMRASASMPIVSRPVEIDGGYYLDGGISDPIPLTHMRELGYTKNVVILTQPKGYRKKGGAGKLMKWLLRKHPAIYTAMKARPDIYNKELDEIEALELVGDILVLRPKEDLGISRTERDPNELERVYQLGREAGKEKLTEIRAFLSRC